MNRNTVTLDEMLATFSTYISKQYPSAQDFRRNFNLLLKGKRKRCDEGSYAMYLERNIVFLNDLVAGAESLMERLLAAEHDKGVEEDLSAALTALEKKARRQTAERHRDAFVEGKAPEFKELFEAQQARDSGYLDKLEFHYRYLMTFRIFLFEFISVLAAICTEYSVSRAASGTPQKIKSHLELTTHYYLGNVSVGEKCGDGTGEERPN
jgi:hypothetical protein